MATCVMWAGSLGAEIVGRRELLGLDLNRLNSFFLLVSLPPSDRRFLDLNVSERAGVAMAAGNEGNEGKDYDVRLARCGGRIRVEPRDDSEGLG